MESNNEQNDENINNKDSNENIENKDDENNKESSTQNIEENQNPTSNNENNENAEQQQNEVKEEDDLFLPHESDQESEPEEFNLAIEDDSLENIEMVEDNELNLNDGNKIESEGNKLEIVINNDENESSTSDIKDKNNPDGDDDDNDIDLDDNFALSIIYNIDSSPAFQYLDDLNKNKGINDEKTRILKEKYRSLHSFYQRLFKFNQYLSKKIHFIQTEFNTQTVEIDRHRSKKFTDNSEIGELKRELIKRQNEVKLGKEREEKLRNEIKISKENRDNLLKSIEEIQQYRCDMMEPELIASIKELKLDYVQKKHQCENLKKDLDEKEKTLSILKKELDNIEMERENQKLMFSKSESIPRKIKKQYSILKEAINSLNEENQKQILNMSQLDKDIEQLDQRREELEAIKSELINKCNDCQREIVNLEKQCNELYKKKELEKDKLHAQKTERVKLDLNIKNVVKEIKTEHDLYLREISDKETALKTYHRLESSVNNIRITHATLKEQILEAEQAFKILKQDSKYYSKEIERLHEKIDFGIYNFLKQEKVENAEKEKMTTNMEINKKLENELEEASKSIEALEKQREKLNIMKELKFREFIKIQNKYRNYKEYSQDKDIIIRDTAKRYNESNIRLKEFSELYNIVKNERNKYVNMIQSTLQRIAEMKEKIKVLVNEIEILRQEIIFKDRELAKQKQANASSYSCRDSCKNEANKLLALYREKREQIDQNISRIESLNAIISNTESELVNMKSKYEAAIVDRNSMGIKILEQNDELCILYEKINIYEEVIKKGEIALGEREEEIKKLKLVKSELCNKIETLKSKEPLLGQYDKKIVDLQIELNKTLERVKELSAKVENPFGKRCNKIKGTDPNESQLLKKITRLEEQLVDKEERLLEKELIYDEINILTERLKKQVTTDRNSSNYFANQLNDLSMKIKNISREMMAKISELSMYQSDTLALYQEKCEKSALLEKAEKNLRNNLPPMDTIEDDIKRYEKKMQREKEFIHMMRQKLYNHGICPDKDDKFYIINNIRTTSIPRPNAYIPHNNGNNISGELPIPKPYGLFAPFKPYEKTVHLRHYRKSVEKPIEI